MEFFYYICIKEKTVMKIINSKKLEDFIKKHADASNAIEKWVQKNRGCELEKSQ